MSSTTICSNIRTPRTYRATCPGRPTFRRIGRIGRRTDRSVRARGVLETIGLVSNASIVHEFGHLVRAKHVGAGVKYVTVGIGPIMAAFEDRDGTLFVLHAFPFGARVVYDDDFESTSGIDRASIFLAGPVANVLCAMFMSAMFFVTHDHIVVDDGASVERVITNGAASKAGIIEGDNIQSVNGIPIVADEASYALAATEMSVAPELEFTVVRNDDPTRVTIDTGATNGRLGVELKPRVHTDEIMSFLEVPGLVGEDLTTTIGATTGAVRDFVMRDVSSKPIRAEALLESPYYALEMVNLSVAIINIVLPGLDGWRTGSALVDQVVSLVLQYQNSK